MFAKIALHDRTMFIETPTLQNNHRELTHAVKAVTFLRPLRALISWRVFRIFLLLQDLESEKSLPWSIYIRTVDRRHR